MSKDKKVIKKFIKFFYNLQKTFSTWNVSFNSNKCKVITVLKSPHVNKTAQEQFEYRIYSKKILISSYKPSIVLLILKKIKDFSFPGLFFKVKILSNKLNNYSKLLNVLKPKNFYLTTNFIENSNIILGILKYIQLFDCRGEILLKTKYFF